MVISEADSLEFDRAVEDFCSRALPKFVEWARRIAAENPPAVLAEEPPNHVYDVADGSMDFTVGREAVERKLDHHRQLATTIFNFKILKIGNVQDVFEFLSTLEASAALEAAMAVYVEHASGSYVSNSPEYQRLEKAYGPFKDNLENPFYKGVCEAIIEKLQEGGLI